MLGVILAAGLSWIIHFIAFWLVVAAVIMGGYLIIKRMIEYKFRMF
jgi:hypothetical protein